MDPVLDDIGRERLIAWIEDSVAHGRNILARGYQGQVYRYPHPRHPLVIKVASGAGPLRWLRAHMLRKEHAVYRRLAGFAGAPRCYGLLDGRFLLLEHVAGEPLRRAAIPDRARFFALLFEYLNELHARGIAHGDLKRKDNLLVTADGRPCLIDFGTAITRRPGFAPVNHFAYGVAERFDFNAWIKLKYDNRMEEISAADRPYYRRTWIEKLARAVKRPYRRLKRRLFPRKL